jgi:hypothetical protein
MLCGPEIENGPTSEVQDSGRISCGSSFESFLKKDGLQKEVHAATLKLDDLMKQGGVSKRARAAQIELMPV